MDDLIKSRMDKVVRWIARIIGTLLLLMIGLFAVGEGVPNPLEMTFEELIEFVAILLISGGYIVGWKWEFSACVMILSGIAVFCAVEIILYHRFPKLSWFFWAMAIPGILYLYIGVKKHLHDHLRS
jgi:hypothetical protein